MARILEHHGIPTVTLNMFHELGHAVAAPRTLMTDHDYGAPFGQPKDHKGHKKILNACFDMLNMPANDKGLVVVKL